MHDASQTLLQFSSHSRFKEHILHTAFGQIYVVESGNPASIQSLLLIHGNSSSSRVWHHILSSSVLTYDYRILAFDLPGHGLSDNAPDPQRTYTMHGYAECAIDVANQLAVDEFVVLGWSLGGHIAIEMMPLVKSSPTVTLKGVMLVGTPPSLGFEQTSLGFFKESKSPHMKLTSQEHFTEEDAYNYAHEATGSPFEEWQLAAALRTDGRARKQMFSAFTAGFGVDQVKVVEEEHNLLLGVVNGATEPFVNLDYLDGLHWGRLWEGRCLRLDGLGHAPFWENPAQFESILENFLKCCERKIY
ncbi:Alpha/Beta hydrolase protein [Lipomyces kononenkoae]